MTQNRWEFRGNPDVICSPEAVAAAENSQLLARLLYHRGLTTPEDIRQFLELEHYEPTSGWELPDMEPAVARIMLAIEKQQAVLIYGDFDVDGITGTSILYEALKTLKAKVTYYIPDRATEGHGLNTAALCRLVSTRQVKLVITTDTGITNFNEVNLLNGLGVDTIVTDHHDLPENLPMAVANVNPKRFEDDSHPLALLSGAGVAFKLCEILLLENGHPQSAVDQLLDITATGLVADMVPLLRENRYLVYRGLQVLNRRERLGFREILEQAGVAPEAQLTSETIGFTIGPRLNAVGRLDKAAEAVALLTTDDVEEARKITVRLEQLNRRRRELCDETYREAEKYLSAHGGLDGHRCIILGSPGWHPGIIGIVASRLIEKYHVPVFLMVIDEDKGEARCSARSIPGFHLHDELLKLSDYFLHFGGHAGAGGFALKLERLESFKTALYALADRTVSDEQMRPMVFVDAVLNWEQINPHLVDLLNKLAPFGQENPSPQFVVENVTVTSQRGLGEEGRHCKLMLTGKGSADPIEGLIWNHGQQGAFDPKEKYRFVVVPELNTFRNVTRVQLIIRDYQGKQTAVSSGPVQPAVPVKVPVAVSEDNLNGNGTAAESEGIRWVDHRHRSDVDVFVQQLLVEAAGDASAIRCFHEGKTAGLPFLADNVLGARHELSPAKTLIFWDMPPDVETLARVVAAVQPNTIHWVGGKYRTVPVFLPGKPYLRAMAQMLREHCHAGSQAWLELEAFAGQMATARPVVMNGLAALEAAKLVTVTSGEAGVTGSLGVQVRWQGRPKDGQLVDVESAYAFAVFQEHLARVGQFRDWLLNVSLDRIKLALAAVPPYELAGLAHHSGLDQSRPVETPMAPVHAG